jgi:hypothetical protein
MERGTGLPCSGWTNSSKPCTLGDTGLGARGESLSCRRSLNRLQNDLDDVSLDEGTVGVGASDESEDTGDRNTAAAADSIGRCGTRRLDDKLRLDADGEWRKLFTRDASTSNPRQPSAEHGPYIQTDPPSRCLSMPVPLDGLSVSLLVPKTSSLTTKRGMLSRKSEGTHKTCKQ